MNRSSAELDWSSVIGVPRWFPYEFADGCVDEMVNAPVASRKRDESGALCADRLYVARDVVWVVLSVHQWSLAGAVAFMGPPSRADAEVVNPPPVPQSYHDAYKAD